MTNPTSNFGWQMPTSTDLVTDLPADFEVFGQAVDTSLADLKGGTTGQVLAKASNTNMDFTWTAIDPLVILDAKGDLITATAADTPARLASSGVNNQVLTIDTSTSTGLKWAAVNAGATQLATASLAGVSTYTFSSISGAYKTLYLELIDSYDNSQEPVNITVNGNTTANYQNTRIQSNNSTVTNTSSAANWYILDNGASTSNRASFLLTLPNYSKTNIRKGFFGNAVQPSLARWMIGQSANDAIRDAAITSITITNNAVNWVGGTLTIYGEN